MAKRAYGIAPVPVLQGSTAPIMTHVAGINVSVFKQFQHKAAALAFVKFLTSPAEQVTLNQSFGSLPVGKAAQSAHVHVKESQDVQRNSRWPWPRCPRSRRKARWEQFIGSAVKGLVATAAGKGSVSEAQVKAR
jgi:multiple sugar transport system substrate-binding protein